MATTKKICHFGVNCYRKNPAHFQEFIHPSKDSKEGSKETPSTSTQVKEPEFQSENESNKQKNVRKGIDSYFVKHSQASKVSKTHTSDDESQARPENTHGTSSQSQNNETAVSPSKQDRKRSPSNEDSESTTDQLEQPSLKRCKTESSSLSQDFFSPKTRNPAVDLSVDYRNDVERLYGGVKMPEDFYLFWDWCKSLNAKNPLRALRPIGLELVGPFEVLAGLHRDAALPDVYWLRHWRYFFDPPEFTTVLRGNDATLLHFGYFRDDPNEMPVFVGFNEAKKNCRIDKKGENLFSALKWYLDDETKRAASASKSHSNASAAGSSSASTWQSDSDRLRIGRALDEWVAQRQQQRQEVKLALQTDAMRARQKRVVCSLFHGGGLVVPVVKNVGYRPVPTTEAELKKTLRAICEAPAASRDKLMDPLCELVNLCQFANDECDYGESIELGLNLFSFGPPPPPAGSSGAREPESPLHPIILQLLPLGYELVRRPLYAKIVREHLAHRSFGAEKLSKLAHHL